MNKLDLGIFGGSFNPIHLGHLRVVEEVAQLFGFSEVVFVPAKNPPLKEICNLIDNNTRYQLVAESIRDNPIFSIYDGEFKRDGPSYSLLTVKELISLRGITSYPYWILGVDAFLNIEKWWNFSELLRICNMVVLSRPTVSGFDSEIKVLAERLGYWYNESYSKKEYSNDNVISNRVSDSSNSGTALDGVNEPDSGSGKNFKEQSITTEELPKMVGSFISSHGTSIQIASVTPIYTTSSEIRARMAQGRSIKYLVPETVYSTLIKGETHQS